MFPKAKCEDPKPTANNELNSSGKAVTKATNTVPTTTLLCLDMKITQKHLLLLFLPPIEYQQTDHQCNNAQY